MTASSVTSLSMDPPMMLVCVNRAVPMAQAVSKSGHFAINVLSDQGASLAHQFATPSDDKFRAVSTRPGYADLPLLADALAHLECEVVEEVAGGSHVIFLGRVVEATAAEEGEPLAYFRGKFGRFEFAVNDEVYRQVRNLIIERVIPADSTVEPGALADRLGVDESATFYALTRLSDDGLVRRDVERGYVVVPLDAITSDFAFDARATIQAGVVERVLGTVTRERITELGEHVGRMAGQIENDHFVDFEAYLESNYRFHRGIVLLADNPALCSAFDSLSLKAVMARSFGFTSKTSIAFVAIHEEILAGLTARDSEATVNALRRYTEMAKERVRQVLAELGGAL